MQIITSSSYNDINITQIDNGSNLMLKPLQSFPIKSFDRITAGNNAQGTMISTDGGNTDFNTYIYVVKFRVYKDFVENDIQYYYLSDVWGLNDPMTCLPANQYSNYDEFTVVYMKRNNPDDVDYYYRYNIRLKGFDKNKKDVFNLHCVGTVETYAIE